MMSSDQQSESHHGVKVPKSEDPVAILPESKESVIVAFPEACLTHTFGTRKRRRGRLAYNLDRHLGWLSTPSCPLSALLIQCFSGAKEWNVRRSCTNS